MIYSVHDYPFAYKKERKFQCIIGKITEVYEKLWVTSHDWIICNSTLLAVEQFGKWTNMVIHYMIETCLLHTIGLQVHRSIKNRYIRPKKWKKLKLKSGKNYQFVQKSLSAWLLWQHTSNGMSTFVRVCFALLYVQTQNNITCIKN